MRYGLLFLALVVVATGCLAPGHNNLPPAEMVMHPGPGVDGPGPGVMTYAAPAPVMLPSSQVAFIGPEGMSLVWDVAAPGAFDSAPLVIPARYNFPQNAIYRLKLFAIPGRPGVELYPTLEIGPAMPRTVAFLAHNAIPIQFTEEDFDQVLSGNFVSKVIYLPDAQYQELALAGVETLVSTRLDPGVDPIVEADRRGAILAIVRLGNKDLQLAGGAMAGAVVGAYGGQPGCPLPGMAGPAGNVPASFVAGVTVPQYGMPMSGTPIGLPGPPHVPLGVPAGLQKHVIRNHTHMDIPEPTGRVSIDVRQDPGMSYPKPANQAFIVEQQIPPRLWNRQPRDERRQVVDPAYGAAVGCANGEAPCASNGSASNGNATAAAQD